MSLSADEFSLLQSATRVGRITKFRIPNGNGVRNVIGEVVDEVAFIRDRHKVVVQKVKYPQHHLWDDAECGYRLGYFTVPRDLFAPPRIVWRNYAMVITETEVDFLLQQAKQKGWRIPAYF